MNIIEAIDLYRFYHTGEEETLALRGVSFHIQPGELVALTGPSGSGKSTMLACLAGLDEPDGGCVTLMGQRITRKSELERARIRAISIGIMLQAGNLFDHLSLENNIRLQMKLAMNSNEKRVTELLEQVGLVKRRHAFPGQVSGGEAARAAIAVALANQPKVLMADEPTSEVDLETEMQILTMFDDFRSRGGAAIIATHSQTLAACADRTVRLVDGRVV